MHRLYGQGDAASSYPLEEEDCFSKQRKMKGMVDRQKLQWMQPMQWTKAGPMGLQLVAEACHPWVEMSNTAQPINSRQILLYRLVRGAWRTLTNEYVR